MKKLNVLIQKFARNTGAACSGYRKADSKKKYKHLGNHAKTIWDFRKNNKGQDSFIKMQ